MVRRHIQKNKNHAFWNLVVVAKAQEIVECVHWSRMKRCRRNGHRFVMSKLVRHQFLQIMIPDSQSYRGTSLPECQKRRPAQPLIDGQPVITKDHDTTQPFRALHAIHFVDVLS